MINTVHTIPLLSLDRIDKVKKLATDPISIAIAREIAIGLGLPNANKSIKCNVDITDESNGTAMKQEMMIFFRVVDFTIELSIF